MKRFLFASAAVVLAASAVLGQARIIGLGNNKYIDDPSRVFENPAKIGQYRDMLYGESGSRVFGTFNLFDGITLGLSAPRQLSNELAFDIASMGAPGADNLHFLLGVGPLGFEVFTEGRSETDVTTIGGVEVDESSSIRSYNLKGGINLSFLDVAAGLGYVREKDLTGSSSTVEAELSGTGLRMNVDGSIMFGGDTRMGAYASYGLETFQEEQSTVVGGVTTEVIDPAHSLMTARAGFLGEFQIGSPAKFYALAGVGMNRQTAKEDATDDQITLSNYVLPELRAGLEYDLGKVWKIEKVLLRAGASKVTTTATTTTTKIGSDETVIKAAGTPGATAWTLGAGMRQGNFSLDATVTPGSLDGIYFLNGSGPDLASITLSYKFRGGDSSSASSYDSGSSYSAPASSSMSSEPSSISSEPATLP